MEWKIIKWWLPFILGWEAGCSSYHFALICEVRMKICDQKYINFMSGCKTITRKCSISTVCFHGTDVSFEDILCDLAVRVPGYISRGPGFDSRRYQIFWEVVGLERGPLSLVSTIEELLGKNSSGSGLENWECGRGDPLRRPRDTLYPQKLALTSLTWDGRSVGRVRLRTKTTEFVLFDVAQHMLALVFQFEDSEDSFYPTSTILTQLFTSGYIECLVTEATAVGLLQSDVSGEESSKSSEAMYYRIVIGPWQIRRTH
jgi:hypothetical protein